MVVREMSDENAIEEFSPSLGPAPERDNVLLPARLWFYQHEGPVLFGTGLLLAGMAVYMGGQRLGWFW